MDDVAQALPTYWLVQASRVAIGGESWGARGSLVIAAWSVVLGALAARAYRRDTNRGQEPTSASIIRRLPPRYSA